MAEEGREGGGREGESVVWSRVRVSREKGSGGEGRMEWGRTERGGRTGGDDNI